MQMMMVIICMADHNNVRIGVFSKLGVFQQILLPNPTIIVELLLSLMCYQMD